VTLATLELWFLGVIVGYLSLRQPKSHPKPLSLSLSLSLSHTHTHTHTHTNTSVAYTLNKISTSTYIFNSGH
jgi:hypothetical protein